MLHIKRVLQAKPKEHEQVELIELNTPWGEELDPEHVLEEHPNPQFARQNYQMLNGWWECAFAKRVQPDLDPLRAVRAAQIPLPGAFTQRILVPFSPEAPLSGVNRQLAADELLWYRREVSVGRLGEYERCLLHFQAVDYACACYANGQFVGSHAGGYLPFTFDITEAVRVAGSGPFEVVLCVADPSEAGTQLRGKQRFDRGDIWYTAQSGIWQSVWLETVPGCYIREARIEADVESQTVTVGARMHGLDPSAAAPFEFGIEVFDDGELVGSASCAAQDVCAVSVPLEQVRLWSPDDPHLYQVRMHLGDDRVESYCGFRTVEVRQAADGMPRVHLNGEPLFVKGVLDQGYWPDGLMTAPSDEALVADIEAMRACGFNTLRKHIKIESARWYYHCDRLGMLVIQDVPNGGAGQMNSWHTSYKPTLFKASWTRYRDDVPGHQVKLGSDDAAFQKEWTDTCAGMVGLLGSHPSIAVWSLFNEGWGQFCAADACALVRKLDPTRPIDATSGWYDQGCGDFWSVHNYFRDMEVWPDNAHGRAFFISEFGGLTYHVAQHSSLEKAYGYQAFGDVRAWRESVHALLDEVAALQRKGLAGYIYTQVSDVEEEVNGILTYDRRVNKFQEA